MPGLGVVQKRAQAGARLLDQKEDAGWESRISLGILDITDPRNCVVAQLNRSLRPFPYTDGLKRYGLDWLRAHEYGFTGDGAQTAAWKDEITKRRTT